VVAESTYRCQISENLEKIKKTNEVTEFEVRKLNFKYLWFYQKVKYLVSVLTFLTFGQINPLFS